MRFSGFEGENNEVCHSVIDGAKFQRVPTTNDFDVVVIGAGVSGLTAAYKLKDKFSLKVIEKENRIGGAASRGNWRGIYYSRGTADTGPSYEINYEGKKINFLEPLFRELSIPWRKVVDPTDAFLAEDHLVIDPFHRTRSVSSSTKDEQAFEAAWDLIEDLQKKYGSPVIPPEANSSGWTELDNKSFRKVFESSGEYFLRFLERYSSSTFGASASEISAFAGLYYLSRELQDRFACPGGNACVSEALAGHLTDSIELNATAVSIEQHDNSCFVTYVDGQGSKITVQSKDWNENCGISRKKPKKVCSGTWG